MESNNVTRSNSTNEKDEEDDEEGEMIEGEDDITFDEFKERYRRLIPYMAFYAASNNLNVESPSSNGKNFAKAITPGDDVVASLRRSQERQQRYQQLQTFPRLNLDVTTRTVLNNYRTSTITNNNNNNNDYVQNQLRKFVPSVQYDPNDINGDGDYFVPLRYNSKVNQIDYRSNVGYYNAYDHDQNQSREEGLTQRPSNVDDDDDDRRYGAGNGGRPAIVAAVAAAGAIVRPYVSTGNTREYVNGNHGLKIVQTNFPSQDYAYDRTSNNGNGGNGNGGGGSSSSKGKTIVDINYPSDVESLRYIPQAIVSKGTQQTIDLLDTVPTHPRPHPHPPSSPPPPPLLPPPPPPPPLPLPIPNNPNGRQPSQVVGVNPQRNFNFININPIIESFQLTERLPETLDKNNLDNSIKTLVEILNILHNAKKEEFPQLPQSSLSYELPNAIIGPGRPIQQRRPPSSSSNHYQRSRPNNRPKVITESRFPAIPTSLLITDDPDRLKSTSSYVNEVKAKPVVASPQALDDFKSIPAYKDNEFRRLVAPKLPVQQIPSYYYYRLTNDDNDNNNNNNNNGKKVVQYVPQDVSQQNNKNNNDEKINHPLEISTQHSYEITEDLSDDLIDPERFAIPHKIITETTTTTIKTTSSKPLPQSNNVVSVDGNEISTTSRPMTTNHHPSSLKYGVTRGKPNVDYPAYAVIPDTEFSCKKQRYKGFFGDPSTGCQVWHYCDLNGGKSSFLCPNGTIFSQVALTCDWWFNVKCESTTQLYVLNERLYKYILPIMPKFPEDFTGPEVDRYLEIKFKEMEAKLREKKLKKQQERKDKANKGKVQTIDDNNKQK